MCPLTHDPRNAPWAGRRRTPRLASAEACSSASLSSIHASTIGIPLPATVITTQRELLGQEQNGSPARISGERHWAEPKMWSMAARRRAPVFRPALAQIQGQVRIPILLPSKLPSAIPERDIKLASGEVTANAYFILLYFSEADLPNTHRVALSGARTAVFRPVSCGGSCAPANLWWQQNGVLYQIQVRLRSGLAEGEQEKIVVETANSIVTARRD